MLRKKLIAIALLATIYSCKNNNQSSSSTPEKSAEVKADLQDSNSPSESVLKPDSAVAGQVKTEKDTNNYRLVIMFFSIGNGVDGKAIKAYSDSINSYSERLGKQIDYRKAHWGREGETDFVMRLNELTPKQQENFIEYTKSTLKGAKWVNIYENFSYQRRGR